MSSCSGALLVLGVLRSRREVDRRRVEPDERADERDELVPPRFDLSVDPSEEVVHETTVSR